MLSLVLITVDTTSALVGFYKGNLLLEMHGTNIKKQVFYV
jgi:hypothetical protein